MSKNNIIQVYNNIFLGTYLNSLSFEKINEKRINCIIFIGSVDKSDYILDKYKKNDIDHYFINSYDESNNLNMIMNNFLEVVKLNNNKNILIHCSTGFSLSIYLIIFYYIILLKERNKISENVTINLLNLIYLKNNRISVSDRYIDLLIMNEKKLIK